MFALFAAVTSDAPTIGVIGAVLALLGTMLKMVWSDRTRGQRIEQALRKSFAEERVARELEFTAEKAAAKIDYQDSLARHKEIHEREIAGYVAELGQTKGRVTVLEAQVVALDSEVAKLRAP